jgi:hypothetical protein
MQYGERSQSLCCQENGCQFAVPQHSPYLRKLPFPEHFLDILNRIDVKH